MMVRMALMRRGTLLRRAAVLALWLAAAWGPAAAQTPPPAKPITLVVGYAAGGSVDLVARALAPGLARRLGQPVQVINVAGASGSLAAVQVALAAPDGHTLLVGSPSEVGLNYLTGRYARFNPQKDLTPIGLVGSQPMVLVANRMVAVNQVEEFLGYVRSHKGARYASAGPGTPLHLAGEMVNQRCAAELRHIPYRGAGPMLPDLYDGRVEFAVLVLSSALQPLREGKLKAIGLTQASRSPRTPDIPALAEKPPFLGLDIGVWFALFGPGKLPPDTAERLRAALRGLLKEAALRQQLEASGLALLEDVPAGPYLQGEMQKYRAIIDLAGLRER